MENKSYKPVCLKALYFLLLLLLFKGGKEETEVKISVKINTSFYPKSLLYFLNYVHSLECAVNQADSAESQECSL